MTATHQRGRCCFIRTVITLYKDFGTKYNPKTQREERVIEMIDVYAGERSPMTEANQIRMFGELERADTVVRFIHNVPDDATLAIMNGVKYKITVLRNYSTDAVIYLSEVGEW